MSTPKKLLVVGVGLALLSFRGYAFNDGSEKYRDEICKLLENKKSCSELEINHADTPPTNSVDIRNGVTINAKNGKKVEFRNVQEPGLDPAAVFGFLGYLPQSEHFLTVGSLHYGEENPFFLVSYSSGEVTSLRGFPHFSPDGTEFVVVPQWHGSITTIGEIYRIKKNEVEKTSTIEFGNCPPNSSCPHIANALWVSSSEFVAFSLDYTKSPKLTVGDFVISVKRKGQEWTTSRVQKK